jgi:hypothetical protein
MSSADLLILSAEIPIKIVTVTVTVAVTEAAGSTSR